MYNEIYVFNFAEKAFYLMNNTNIGHRAHIIESCRINISQTNSEANDSVANIMKYVDSEIYAIPVLIKTIKHRLPYFHDIPFGTSLKVLRYKIINKAKRKIKELGGYIQDIHNLKLYCDCPGQYDICLLGHEFWNISFSHDDDRLIISYAPNGIVWWSHFIFTNIDSCILTDYVINAITDISLIEKTLINTHRYMIVKMMISIMEYFNWDLTNIIIDFAV